MDIIIGSARRDERGKYSQGKVGDSLQKSVPDYSGEVSMQKFYIHSKGWYVLVPKNADVGLKIAEAMIRACNNPNIGYSQSDRYSVLKYGTRAKVKCNCDCSSLVRLCIKEATGIDPGDFTTLNAVVKLSALGIFEKAVSYTTKATLYTGCVLCTKTKGHIVVVTSGNSMKNTVDKNRFNITKTSKNGLNLIQSFEGFRSKAYKAKSTDKYYTIGYGHCGSDVKYGMTVTKTQAATFLASDIRACEKAVIATGLNLNQNQFDALVSFTRNCGQGNLTKLIKNRNLSEIADAILLYNKSNGKTLAGLKRRREAERNLFLQ